MKAVNHTPDTLPPLTEAQKSNLVRLNALSDRQIDTDDLPELTDAQMAKMERGRFYRPVKRQITARLDADVLAWLKAEGNEQVAFLKASTRKPWRSKPYPPRLLPDKEN